MKFDKHPALSVRIVLSALLVAAGACTDPGEQSENQGPRPNVLIVMTDDQRAEETFQVMPATRRLIMRQGARFTRAVATTPQCCPSRASIMTGLYSHNHGVLGNTRRWALEIDEERTLQRYLQDAGYRTGFFGKYLNDWPADRAPKHFDEWAAFGGGHRFYYRGGRWNVDGEARTVDAYYTDYIRRRGGEFIRTTDEPWLLYLNPTAPHSPFEVEERYKAVPVPEPRTNPATFAGLEGKPASLEKRGRRLDITQKRRRKQLRTLMSVDDLVRGIMKDLRQTDQLNNTLIFFMSDNGYLWGEWGLESKSVPYVQSALIPLLVRWDGHIEPGSVSDEIVANIDVPTTVMSALQIRPPEPMDGKSLLDALDGDVARDEILLDHLGLEEKGIPRWSSILGEKFQYIEWYRPNGKVQHREYYDLVDDPWQLDNLLADEDEANDPNVARLSAELGRLKGCSAESCP